MHSAIESFHQHSRTTPAKHDSSSIGQQLLGQGDNASPSTIVLQPSGELNHENSPTFREMLEQAVELASEGVIVDLLWIQATDAAGISALVAGAEKAALLGKIISFQAMSHQTRIAMEQEWERQRQQRFGTWSDRFAGHLEHFLDHTRRN